MTETNVKPVLKKSGKYTNLNMKETFKDNGDFIIIQKTSFAEGYKNTSQSKFDDSTYDWYNCPVIIDGQEASFILYEQDHERFAAFEPEATLRMQLVKEMYVDKGGRDKVKKYFVFEQI